VNAHPAEVVSELRFAAGRGAPAPDNTSRTLAGTPDTPLASVGDDAAGDDAAAGDAPVTAERCSAWCCFSSSSQCSHLLPPAAQLAHCRCSTARIIWFPTARCTLATPAIPAHPPNAAAAGGA
jgi:hypothetical protein